MYDGDKNVYQFFLEKETQTLYWMEASNVSAQSGVFKKSSLSNFNPVNIGYFSGNINDFRNIYATQDGVFYYTRGNYVNKIENNITEVFLSYGVQGGIWDFSIDDDGNYFYTSYNNINSSSLTDPIFSGGSGSYTQFEIILDDENAKVYCLDLADGRIFSTDYSGNDYTEYLPTSWSQQIVNQNLRAFDVVLENNIPTFFVQFESTIIKCTNENDTQVISSFDINNSYYQYYEVFALNNDLIINNDNNSEEKFKFKL